MINYDNPPFKRISGIRTSENIDSEIKQEMFLDMMLQDFKEGTVTQENITKTYFDLEENQKPFSLLEDVPLTWGTSVSYDDERNTDYILSKKQRNRQNI